MSQPKAVIRALGELMTFLRITCAVTCLALLLHAATGVTTLVEQPAEMKVRQTLLGKFKIYVTAKGDYLPNEINRISVMRYGEDGQNFKRDNIFCPCGVECEIDSIPLSKGKNLIGIWDKKLDSCEKAPRGEYSVTLIGPVEQDGRVLPVVYASAAITLH